MFEKDAEVLVIIQPDGTLSWPGTIGTSTPTPAQRDEFETFQKFLQFRQYHKKALVEPEQIDRWRIFALEFKKMLTDSSEWQNWLTNPFDETGEQSNEAYRSLLHDLQEMFDLFAEYLNQ